MKLDSESRMLVITFRGCLHITEDVGKADFQRCYVELRGGKGCQVLSRNIFCFFAKY